MYMYLIVLFDLFFYSMFVLGYFDEDDVLDFMVYWSIGVWLMYNVL